MLPISKLFLPPPALSGCMFAAIYRDTRGAKLSAPDRVSHFPASPLVSVTLVRHGALHLLGADGDWRRATETPALPKCAVMAPQNMPTSSWAPADVEAVSLGIYPDAWRSLGGDEGYADIPACLVTALECFQEATDTATGWQAFCNSLAPHWAQSRPMRWQRATDLTDWVKELITRAALSGAGQSLRSFERRMKRYSGQARRTLEFFSAMERLQEIAHQNAGAPLAEIAHQAGYADQSHMGRAVHRATGFSPARLNQAIQTDEAFWCYRLLGERF